MPHISSQSFNNYQYSDVLFQHVCILKQYLTFNKLKIYLTTEYYFSSYI